MPPSGDSFGNVGRDIVRDMEKVTSEPMERPRMIGLPTRDWI